MVPSAMLPGAGFTPTLINRRIAVRYPCGLATETKMALAPQHPWHEVAVTDISTGGIALRLDQPLAAGLEVFLLLRNLTYHFSYELSGHVIHSRPTRDGQWLIGLEFIRELTLQELATLL